MLRIIAEIRVDRTLQIANRMDLATNNRYIGASDAQAYKSLQKLHRTSYTSRLTQPLNEQKSLQSDV